jgi:hypothetical protein
MSLWTQAAAHTGASSGRAPAHLVAQPIASVTHLIVQSRMILWLSRAASGSSAPPVSAAEAVAMRREEERGDGDGDGDARGIPHGGTGRGHGFSGLWLFGAFVFVLDPATKAQYTA